MKRLRLALLCLFLGGCESANTPITVVPAQGPEATALGKAQEAQISTLKAEVEQKDRVAASAAGNVYGAQKAKDAILPDQPAKDAVGQELSLASEKLPPPSVEDQLLAEKRVTAILTGKLEEAKALYGNAAAEAAALKAKTDAFTKAIADKDAEIAALKTKAETERIAQAKDLQAKFDAKEAQIKQAVKDAQDQAKKEQRRWITGIFFGLGAIMFAGGVVVLVTAGSVPMFGPKAGFALMGAGGSLITLGIIITQIENFFELHPWIVGGSLIAIALAVVVALSLLWSNHHHDTNPTQP